ncbi:AraC family transcriptional regulator [Dyadobacter sp. CY261]|uniref:AraC family transcriptional regulator n=1 Tax=Dyadobacter sp. CY261 TaxID=2907203 RepID=UPI001F47FC8B|nr:AraC family transcriptional regulator [Dyadobacter sp. CY261]MCF0069723.1 AraC family transcriptional regulator [Dyadobacter sp. CY261]
MKPLIQKLPVDESSSFVARTYTTPNFETPWHQHVEYELVLQSCGSGTAFIGDYIGEYQMGDVFLLGRNLPHWFRKNDPAMMSSAIVVQFREELFQGNFLLLPEMQLIGTLLQNASQGVLLTGSLKEMIGDYLKKIESLAGFPQMGALLDCLHQISVSEEVRHLTNFPIVNLTKQDQNHIHLVFEYSMQHFQRKVRVEEVAALTNKSVSAFCHYFKKSTKKSYVNFLTEIRIAHACKLLATTDMSVTEICYESGFQNWSNFSAHFVKQVRMSPLKYRKRHTQLQKGQVVSDTGSE